MKLNCLVFCLSVENEVDMIVLPTLTESDLLTIGVGSFGARRKLSLLVQQINAKQPSQALEHSNQLDILVDPTITINMIPVSIWRTLKINEWPHAKVEKEIDYLS